MAVAADWATGRLEYAPGFTPLTAAPGDGDWVELGTVVGFESSRGRQDDRAEMEPGTAAAILDDRDGTILAAAVERSIPANTAARFVVTYDGADYVRFSGYLLDAPQPDGPLKARRMRVHLTDWLGWASSVDLPSTKWATLVSSLSPLLWWSDLSTGAVPLRVDLGDAIINQGTAGAPGDFLAGVDPLAGYPAYADAFEASPVPGASSARSWASGYMATRGEVDTGTAFSVVLWLKALTNPPGPIALFWQSAAGVYTWLLAMNADGSLEVRLYNTAGAYVSATAVGDHADGAWHVVTFRVNGTTASIRSDLDTSWATSASRTGTLLREGLIETPSSTTFGFNWADFVLVPQALATTHPLLDAAAWEAGGNTIDLWANETTAQRVTRLCEAAQAPAPGVQDHGGLSSALLKLAPYTGSGTLGEQVRRVGKAGLGTAWVTVDGELRLRDFAALDDATFAAYYADRLASLTDSDLDAYTPAEFGVATFGSGFTFAPPDLPVVRYLPTDITPGRADRVVNWVRVVDPNGDSFGAYDADSITQHGRRTLELEVDLVSVGSAAVRPGAERIVAAYAQPPAEVGSVVVEPWESATATAFVLAAELESPVHFRMSDPATGAALIDGDFRIQSEKWSWPGGRRWTVTYTIAPA